MPRKRGEGQAQGPCSLLHSPCGIGKKQDQTRSRWTRSAKCPFTYKAASNMLGCWTLDAFRLQSGKWPLLGSYAGDDSVRVEPFQEVAIYLGDLWLGALPGLLLFDSCRRRLSRDGGTAFTGCRQNRGKSPVDPGEAMPQGRPSISYAPVAGVLFPFQ